MKIKTSRPDRAALTAECEEFYRRHMPANVWEQKIKFAAQCLTSDILQKWDIEDVK